MKEFSSVLMVAGQQQNVGKTTLICNIISHFSRFQPVYAIKVSPHFHKNTAKAQPFIKEEGFEVLEEKEIDGNKDTSRMLKAGAERSFLLQAEHEKLESGFIRLLQELPENVCIVCESAGLRDYIKPGVFIMLRQLYCKICSIEDEKMFKLADRIVTYTVNGFDFPLSSLSYIDDKWKLNS